MALNTGVTAPVCTQKAAMGRRLAECSWILKQGSTFILRCLFSLWGRCCLTQRLANMWKCSSHSKQYHIQACIRPPQPPTHPSLTPACTPLLHSTCPMQLLLPQPSPSHPGTPKHQLQQQCTQAAPGSATEIPLVRVQSPSLRIIPQWTTATWRACIMSLQGWIQAPIPPHQTITTNIPPTYPQQGGKGPEIEGRGRLPGAC